LLRNIAQHCISFVLCQFAKLRLDRVLGHCANIDVALLYSSSHSDDLVQTVFERALRPLAKLDYLTDLSPTQTMLENGVRKSFLIRFIVESGNFRC
jgi:hypothetical protein